jgi:hypothetical protein
MPGVLYAKVNGQWVVTAPEEVNISDTDPLATNPDGEIWVDTSTTPPSLKANVGGTWTTITAGAETEVSIGPEDPYVFDPTATEGSIELWHDTTLDPGTMKARVAGVWQPIAGSDEMSVGALDPMAVNPRIEMWYDTDSTDAPPTLGILKVNVGGTWHVATPEEVFVDDQDPLSRGNTEAELWYDTTTSTLKANVNGTWVEVSGSSQGPAPLDEVWVGPVDPRDASTELWYDVDAVPTNTGLSVGIVESMMIEMSQMRSDLADARTRITMLEAHLQVMASV